MIRYARASDHPAIALLVTAAFGRSDEAALVAQLRADEDCLFEMVVEEDGEVLGHVLFSRLWADRFELYGALAPVSVRPDHHGKGLGSKLIRAGLEGAREFGCFGVLVLGDPAYYGRFGFSADAARQVKAPFSGLPAFQALALEENAFEGDLSITYPNAFNAAPSGPL